MQSIAGKILFDGVGELMLVYFAKRGASTEEYETYSAKLKAFITENGAKPGALLFGEYPPNASQRRLIAERMDNQPELQAHRIALLTTSAVARGALIAVGWLTHNKNQEMKPFSPTELDQALLWLGKCAHFDADAARQTVKALMAAAE